MDERRQNSPEKAKGWPSSIGGKPLPPAVEEWLSTMEERRRKRRETRAEAERHLKEAGRIIDDLKRSLF